MPPEIVNLPPENGQPMRFRLRDIVFDEPWVDGAIESAGGYRVRKKHAFPDGVRNCDYRLEHFFIELKILEKDAFDAPERREKLLHFFEKHRLLHPEGPTTIESSSLSELQLREYGEIYLSAVERLAADANRQIRATAAHLGVTDFKGAVLVVNKECESVEGHTIRRYLSHLIAKEQFSSLHYGLCFSAIPAVAEGHNPVIGFDTSQAETEKDQRVIDAVASAFKAKVETELGKTLAPAPSDLPPAFNLRDHRAYLAGDTRIMLVSPSREAAVSHQSEMRPLK